MSKDEQRPMDEDATAVETPGPAAFDDDPTVLDSATRERAAEEAAAGGAPATPQAMLHDASTVVARGPDDVAPETRPHKPPTRHDTKPARPAARHHDTTPAPPAVLDAEITAELPGAPPPSDTTEATAPEATAKGARKAPKPMLLEEGTGITKLIAAAMNRSERRRQVVAVGAVLLLVLLLAVLFVMLPTSPLHSRLNGWIDALPSWARDEPDPPVPTPTDAAQTAAADDDRADDAGGRRSARARRRGPESSATTPLEALQDAPRSRKLDADVDAASSRMRADRGSVAQPLKSRGGASSSRALGIGELPAGRDAADHAAAPLDEAGAHVSLTGKVVTLDGLSRTVAQKVFARAETQFRFCYEDALERRPAARGRVKLAVSVTAAGTVRKASVTESQLDDPKADACVARVAERLRFPAAAAAAEVSYLWIFVPGQ